MSSRVAFVTITVVLALGCTSPSAKSEPAPTPAAKPERPRPVVVIETDFGTKDDAVALLRGVILSIARDAQVCDLTNEIPPFDIETGAQDLEDAPGIFPEGTVFVVVVDPGVGTARKSIAVQLKNGRFLVGPDNGVLSLAMEKYGVQSVREITNHDFHRRHESETFHGRDVFSPTGAHLALGDYKFDDVGPELKEWVKLAYPIPVMDGDPDAPWKAVVAKLDDPYGNIWTNAEQTWFQRLAIRTGPVPESVIPFGTKMKFEFASGRTVSAPLKRTFGEVPEGQPLAYWNSRGRLSLAINMGDAAKTYGVKRGDKVTISREK